MRSNIKCKECGEFLPENSYAMGIKEGQSGSELLTIGDCDNFEKCPIYNKEN